MDKLQIQSLTPDRWNDFAQLFGPRGACAGCWCMFWKLPRKEYDAGRGDANREAQHALIASGRTPGLLAYVDGVPAGWIAVEPRSEYPGLARSRVLASQDETPVWSVPCFFVDKHFRRQGLTVVLLKAAVDYVKAQGGKVVEGYPVETKDEKAPAGFPGRKISLPLMCILPRKRKG